MRRTMTRNAALLWNSSKFRLVCSSMYRVPRLIEDVSLEKETLIPLRAYLDCLIEGCSIRATVRMTGVAKKTVMRLLVEVGEVRAVYQDQAFRNLRCKRLQPDELLSMDISAKKRTARRRLHARIRMLVTFGCGYGSQFIHGAQA
jgi:hypothetical protein